MKAEKTRSSSRKKIAKKKAKKRKVKNFSGDRGEKTLLINILHDTLDKNSSDTVELLIGKKNVNEFLIAKKLNLSINQIRNILYKLSDIGLVSFTRKKDKRKGWYTYFWTLNLEKSYTFLENILKKRIDELNSQLKSRKTKRFYFCNTCKTEVSEETALLNNFTCKECGEVYDLADNEKPIKELRAKMAKIQRDYDILEIKMTEIRQVEEKRAERDKKKVKKRKVKKIVEKKIKKKVGKKKKK